MADELTQLQKRLANLTKTLAQGQEFCDFITDRIETVKHAISLLELESKGESNG
jgi:hypothetical protein